MANANCLGLYIEEHLIKYAKVSKERDKIKIEAFGVMVYEKLGEAISQIIQETYSQKTPISMNLSEEMYNYFDMFALLTKKDLQKAVRTEFDSFCSDKGYNPNVFETRYAVVGNEQDKEKIKVIHIAQNKIELNKEIQAVSNYRVSNISPISMAIPDLINTKPKETPLKENSLIVNIEEETTVTTILDNKIYHIDKIEQGSADFLSRINIKENSYSKAYEICKNTTIYTSDGRDLQNSDQTYLNDIMPTIYTIVSQVKHIVDSYAGKLKKVYITGTAALVNNIDLYFQEYLDTVDCEILRPYFIDTIGEINIKDYVEVNSAIAMALEGIGEGVTGINFKDQTLGEKIPNWLKIETSSGKGSTDKKGRGNMFTWDLGQKMNHTEMSLLRVATFLLLLVIFYSIFSGVLTHQMNEKERQAKDSIENTNQQIKLANSDNEKIQSKINEYSTMIQNLEDASDKITDRNRTRNAIPNLLNQIMSIVPENVQLTSIENTTNTHVVINAQSNKYEQLGYLKAKIKTDVILTNVISTAGQKDDSIVTVKIEGDLP